MLNQRVALLSVVDLGREGVQGVSLSLFYPFPFHPGSGWFPHEVTTKVSGYNMRDVLQLLPYPQRIVYRVSALVRRCI